MYRICINDEIQADARVLVRPEWDIRRHSSLHWQVPDTFCILHQPSCVSSRCGWVIERTVSASKADEIHETKLGGEDEPKLTRRDITHRGNDTVISKLFALGKRAHA